VNKSFSEELAEWSDYSLLNCIGVDECMKVCPVADPSRSINELNDATFAATLFTDGVLKFAIECVQCGRCDAVCPTQAGRSVMMLKLKEKVVSQGNSPFSHRKYFVLKGHDKNSIRRVAFNFTMKAKWKIMKSEKLKHEKLARHIDKSNFKKSEFLFYFGCYIFTKEMAAARCVDLADRLGMDYEVLGGLKSCCGWPQLLAGRTGEAEDYHGYLSELILKSSPNYVITGCAECYMSLNKVATKYDHSFQALTTPQWLNMFSARLGLSIEDDPVTFHDSCHISRKSGMPEPARKLLGKLNPLTEMKRSGARDTFCCGYWGLKANQTNLKEIHNDRLNEAKGTGAGRMVVECITCAESFAESAEGAGVEVVDIVDLVYERSSLT